MKRFLILLSLCLATCLLFCGCDSERPDQSDITDINNSPVTPVDPVTDTASEENVEIPATPEGEPYTYQQDDAISKGDSSDIVIAHGVLRETGYSDLLPNGGWILGADAEQHILVLDGNTYDLEMVSPEGNHETIIENVMGDRGKQLECAAWDGGRYVTWSESPNAGIWNDETRGAEWGVYLADLQTKQIICIDQDVGIRPAADSIVTYLAPVYLDISDGMVSYISFASQNNQAIQAIMLYNIETQQLTPIGYLQGTCNENALGHPSIGNGYVAWSQAYVRPDALYEGYTVLYNVSTQETSIWDTDENVINPCIVGDYLICEGKPNETFYDGEIIMFDQRSGTVLRRMTSDYPSYARRNQSGVSLRSITSSGGFFTWCGSLITDVCLIDSQTGELFVISDDNTEITNVSLYPGNLLIWADRDVTENGELAVSQYYCFLK